MQIETLFPWQMRLWESLLQRKTERGLPHALLFSGVDGVGQYAFALNVAKYVLCGSQKEKGACGECRSCRLYQSESHPDFVRVEPEKGAQLIKIDQIREVVNFVNATPLLNGYRVILIHPASLMNIYASNALLKTLEEPTANTLLILISHPGLPLLATLRSRCQTIYFPIPDRDIALTWLRSEVKDKSDEDVSVAFDLADGAPILARDYLSHDIITLRRDLYDSLLGINARSTDPLQMAAKWEDKDIKMLFHLLLSWVQDLLRCQLTDAQAKLVNQDYYSAISRLTKKLAQEDLLHYVDMIQKYYAHLLSSLNMNRLLLLRELFIRWAKLC